MPTTSRQLEARFWSRVAIPAGSPDVLDDACWPWDGPGSITSTGHVRVAWPAGPASPGGKGYVNRIGFLLSCGPIGDGIVRHLCGPPPNPRCVRPTHLSAFGGHVANAADRDAAGRRIAPTGEYNGRARLTQGQAEEIRAARAAGRSVADLAQAYGVGRTTVRTLLAGRSYPPADR